MCPPASFEGGVARSETLKGERPEAVRIRLLGGFRVLVGSRTIEGDEWRLRKAASLVKLLTLAPNHRLHREQVMDLLWPDLGRQAASNNLRKTLHAARRTLDPDSGSRYLASEDESLVLCAGGGLWIDVEAFEEAAATARRARDPAAYRAAIELYTGDLLPEARYEEWVENRRENLRQLYLALLIELAGLYEERDEPGLAIEALRKATAKEPTLEEAHTGLMRLHAFSGRPEQAIAQYERLRDALLRGLGTAPGEATRHLRDEIAAGRLLPTPSASPPSQEESPEPNKHNLPAPRTSFIGREREMTEVKRTLAMTRLLTLTGAGGSGKTRFALEAARDLMGAYPNGVWLVELASLSEPDLVAQAVGEALEVSERPGQPLTDTLVEALAGKEMLLVMDNCEHLIEAAAQLVDVLLDSCPRLKVLATSREPLGVSGEVNWVVPPLSLPTTTDGSAQEGFTVESLMRYEAVRLFVDRARLRLPDFEVTQENAGVVARVCRKLDGIPLAIELAAARMGALAVEQVAQRLEVSLDVLKGANRTAEARQQTLRATLDWSYNLLSETERVVFRRLSVFGGGWTLEAAEAVCSGGSIEKEDVLDLLGGLVDKSLVVARASTTGSAVRYRMLEPVRQYALEELEESGEAEEVKSGHATFFLALAEEAEPGVKGAQQAVWLERLEAEHDNLRAALSWSLGQGQDAELALRMSAALGEFWSSRGFFGEGRRWLEEALANASLASTPSRTIALEGTGLLAFLQGDLNRAEEACEEGLELAGVELFRTADGDSVAAALKRMLGIAVANRGEVERAMELFEESLALSRAAGSDRGAAISLLNLGIEWRVWGDFGRSTELYEEALTLCRQSGAPWLLAATLSQLALTFLLQGDLERATATSKEAAAIAREQKHRFYLADALTNLGWAVLLRDDHERAKALFAQTLGLRREVGDKLMVPYTLQGLASVAAARGVAERAARLFGAAEALHEVMGTSQETGERALWEPYLVAARSQLDEAAWDTAWAEGGAMGLEEIMQYALSEEGLATAAPPTPGQAPAHKSPPLTPREEEVATLVARGLTNRQIASELSISEHTVANHVAKILRKLGFDSRSQITAWVVEQRTSP